MNNLCDEITRLKAFIENHQGKDKSRLTSLLQLSFGLIRDRSVFYHPTAPIAFRLSSAKSATFSNTVLSLSNLQKHDHRLFIVCLVTPNQNHLFIANSTFLSKISHSSHALSLNNIRGSFNGSDIVRNFEGIENNAANLERLFYIHQAVGFDENLPRLVEANSKILPTGAKFEPSELQLKNILEAPSRAFGFCASKDFETLKAELDSKVSKYKNEILLAALIENVNIRGRVIEYLIAGDDEGLRSDLVAALTGRARNIPDFTTKNALGDYEKIFSSYITQTDIKTKIMLLDSNPKAYNLDKILSFLSEEKTVFLFYFIGLEPGKLIAPALVSAFQTKLLKATILLKHWAGRNSRGVSQLEGREIKKLIQNVDNEINLKQAEDFLRKVLAL